MGDSIKTSILEVLIKLNKKSEAPLVVYGGFDQNEYFGFFWGTNTALPWRHHLNFSPSPRCRDRHNHSPSSLRPPKKRLTSTTRPTALTAPPTVGRQRGDIHGAPSCWKNLDFSFSIFCAVLFFKNHQRSMADSIKKQRFESFYETEQKIRETPYGLWGGFD